ncbi:11562_t:CDS:2, partial [Acaulospora colombiana]
YHAFLDLMSQNPALFLVPTLDLAWHTHQLKGDQYRLDTQTYLQRTPNHDDNVEATSLSIAYDITAKAWKDRLSIFDHKREKSDNSIEDTLVNTRPDLVTTEDHEADTSHPSEHNVYFGDRDQWRALQAERAEKTQLALLDDNDGNKRHKEAFTDTRHGYDHYYAYWGVSAAIPLGLPTVRLVNTGAYAKFGNLFFGEIR